MFALRTSSKNDHSRRLTGALDLFAYPSRRVGAWGQSQARAVQYINSLDAD